MTVLVTGGAGFVGVNLVAALLERGEEVVLCDGSVLPPAAERALKPHARALTVLCGNVLDAQFLQRAFAGRRITNVVHCAAVTSGPQREAREPAVIVEVNLAGTIGVLDAARRHGVRRVVYVGSGALYGESLFRLERLYEDSPAFPETMYAITKHAAERICRRLRELWQIDVACVRLGTVIGPWERDTGARDNYGTHTQLAGLAVRGETAVLTPREVRRDWVYAKDVAAGIIALIEANSPQHFTYNLSSGVEWETPIVKWCDALKGAFAGFDYRVAAAGETPNVWYTDKDRNIMDTSRITRDMGFAARYLRDAAYADFIEWIGRNRDFYLPS
jgi:nucleoside-diphosphate-sugar epimerase